MNGTKQTPKKIRLHPSLPLSHQHEPKRTRTLKKIGEEQLSSFNTPHATFRHCKALPEVKITIAQVLREGARVQKKAEEAKKLMKDLCTGSADPFSTVEMLDGAREQENAVELRDMEKKHLLGLLSREQAKIARSAVFKANRVNALELKQESQELERQLKDWRRLEKKRIREMAERNQCTIEQARLAQAKLLDKKRQTARQIQDESRELQRRIDEQKKRELDQKISLIRQIREFEQLSKSSAARDYDANCSDTRSQADSIGVSCRMSIVQLKDSLVHVREKVKEQVQRQRENIQFEHNRQQKHLKDTMRHIERYKNIPKPSKLKTANHKEVTLTPDLIKLRKKLELKRFQAASAEHF